MKNFLHQMRETFVFEKKRFLRAVQYWCARRVYAIANKKREGSIRHPREIGVIPGDPRDEKGFFHFPSGYPNLINDLYSQILEKMSLTENCHFYSADAAVERKLNAADGLPERTEDLPELRAGLVWRYGLKKTTDLRGLEELCAMLLPQIERAVYHSRVIVSKPIVYRSPVCVLEEARSTLWHSDNDIDDETKLFIYLTDVLEEGAAPLEYLAHGETGKTVHVRSSMPRRYARGRVPADVIQGYQEHGYQKRKFFGKKGSLLLFDNKIIHKGNNAKTRYRDVLVLQIRPTVFARRAYIDPRWSAYS